MRIEDTLQSAAGFSPGRNRVRIHDRDFVGVAIRGRVFTRPEWSPAAASAGGEMLQSAAGFSPGRNADLEPALRPPGVAIRGQVFTRPEPTRRTRCSRAMCCCNPRPGFHPAGTTAMFAGVTLAKLQSAAGFSPSRNDGHVCRCDAREVAIRGRVFTQPERLGGPNASRTRRCCNPRPGFHPAGTTVSEQR